MVATTNNKFTQAMSNVQTGKPTPENTASTNPIPTNDDFASALLRNTGTATEYNPNKENLDTTDSKENLEAKPTNLNQISQEAKQIEIYNQTKRKELARIAELQKQVLQITGPSTSDSQMGRMHAQAATYEDTHKGSVDGASGIINIWAAFVILAQKGKLKLNSTSQSNNWATSIHGKKTKKTGPGGQLANTTGHETTKAIHSDITPENNNVWAE